MRAALAAALAGLALAAAACALVPEPEPGCHADGDCDPGFSCRAGACFRPTTGETPPKDPADAAAD